MTIDLDRLRELAKEPERDAMPRTSQFPSMTDQLLRQKAEIDALRRGLADAIVEIESLYAQVAEAWGVDV
jgi:predicted transcriptional regulator